MKVFHGTVVHSTEIDLEIKSSCHVGVDGSKICFVEEGRSDNDIKDQYDVDQDDITHLIHGEFLLPGFIDTHIHAGQYSNTGKALDLPLLDWLGRYTFPTEAKFADPVFANDVYDKCVKRTLNAGTTTACYYATIHTDATIQLCDIIEKRGQRAYVGKVNMDQNSPEYYIEKSSESLAETERFIKNVMERNSSLIEPVLTPRFSISTSEQLMKQLGELARSYDLPIQTHISENRKECKVVMELYNHRKHYLDIYDACGLLTNKTILAHGIYLSDEELSIIKNEGSGISHCPNSNLSIRSGFCHVERLLNNSIKTGLGTDCSGGYSYSLLDAMRQAIQVSNVLSIQNEESICSYKSLSYKDVLRLATIGGAQVMGLDDKVGNFTVGKEFDALHVSLVDPLSTVDIFAEDTIEDIIQKFVFCGDDRNIKSVFVGGQKVES